MNKIDNEGVVKPKKWLHIVTLGCVVMLLAMPQMKCNAETTVSSGDAVEIPVTELDMGDCPKEMVVGTSQMLSVLKIPANATKTEFTYESDNEEVATVNALGRLTAKAIGKARITVACGGVSNSFEVSVVSSLGNVLVADIEIDDFEQELAVDKTMYLSAKVLPTNATNALITYASSDEQVATVNSSGQVKGISPGQVTIEISAGDITKEVYLTVKMETKAINLNSDYVVLKPGETFEIKATVNPEGASSEFTYKSLDSAIAVVSDAGIITAKSTGVTTITVSNDNLQESISIVVNEEGKQEVIDEIGKTENSNLEKTFPETVMAKKYSVITSDMLKYFYEQEKTLTIKGNGYTIFVDGRDIVNFENELNTRLEFVQEEDGMSFVVNGDEKLCGKVTIDVSEQVTTEKYLYLYNEAKEKYERLEVKDITLLAIDSNGKYLLTTEALSKIDINGGIIIVGVGVCIVGSIIYIVCKKKYWFW